ncbi:MAG: NAD(P)-dependent alcohol dehydrogenase [Streptosporangiaceae bacterium]
MQAAVHTRYGPPEVVRVIDVEQPTAKGNELLVKVHATTVNRTDCHYRSGQPFFMRFLTGLAKPRRTILGTEFAGEIAAVGRDVTSFKVGDRVFGYNEGPFGTHAEYLVIPESGLVAAMPANLTYQQAAAATEGSHYALAHIRRAKIGRGQYVLVYGASGGIGSAAVQLLKSHGAQVTAVCDTKNVALVASLGADKVVDYTAEDFSSDSQAYDVVFDAVGRSSFGRCKRLLKPGGVFMSTGPGPGYQNLMLPVVTALLPGKKVLFAYPHFDQAALRYIGELMESGEFKPVIDREYPLDQIAEAYRYVETGQKIGNVVISVVPASR